MCSLRDTIIFLAGAVFFHMLSHILLPYIIALPFNFGFMTLTSTMNVWVIAINALLVIVLLWLAGRMKH